MQQAMAAAKTAEERALVVNRCRTSYSIESLRYVLPYLEQPEFVQLACETIVELAHHRELANPIQERIRSAVDKVIKLSKDAVVVDRANRYKTGVDLCATKANGRDQLAMTTLEQVRELFTCIQRRNPNSFLKPRF